MEDKLDLIIIQNWALLGLLAFLVISNIACNLYSRLRDKNFDEGPQFGNLWETDQIDELLKESDKMLNEYPNRVDALYFRALALRKIGKHEEALNYFERVIEVDPSFSDQCVREINDIKDKTANK